MIRTALGTSLPSVPYGLRSQATTGLSFSLAWSSPPSRSNRSSGFSDGRPRVCTWLGWLAAICRKLAASIRIASPTKISGRLTARTSAHGTPSSQVNAVLAHVPRLRHSPLKIR